MVMNIVFFAPPAVFGGFLALVGGYLLYLAWKFVKSVIIS